MVTDGREEGDIHCLKHGEVANIRGISVVTDGSDDGDIHCLKHGEVEAEAAPEIAWLTY